MHLTLPGIVAANELQHFNVGSVAYMEFADSNSLSCVSRVELQELNSVNCIYATHLHKLAKQLTSKLLREVAILSCAPSGDSLGC